MDENFNKQIKDYMTEPYSENAPQSLMGYEYIRDDKVSPYWGRGTNPSFPSELFVSPINGYKIHGTQGLQNYIDKFENAPTPTSMEDYKALMGENGVDIEASALQDLEEREAKYKKELGEHKKAVKDYKKRIKTAKEKLNDYVSNGIEPGDSVLEDKDLDYYFGEGTWYRDGVKALFYPDKQREAFEHAYSNPDMWGGKVPTDPEEGYVPPEEPLPYSEEENIRRWGKVPGEREISKAKTELSKWLNFENAYKALSEGHYDDVKNLLEIASSEDDLSSKAEAINDIADNGAHVEGNDIVNEDGQSLEDALEASIPQIPDTEKEDKTEAQEEEMAKAIDKTEMTSTEEKALSTLEDVVGKLKWTASTEESYNNLKALYDLEYAYKEGRVSEEEARACLGSMGYKGSEPLDKLFETAIRGEATYKLPFESNDLSKLELFGKAEPDDFYSDTMGRNVSVEELKAAIDIWLTKASDLPKSFIDQFKETEDESPVLTRRHVLESLAPVYKEALEANKKSKSGAQDWNSDNLDKLMETAGYGSMWQKAMSTDLSSLGNSEEDWTERRAAVAREKPSQVQNTDDSLDKYVTAPTEKMKVAQKLMDKKNAEVNKVFQREDREQERLLQENASHIFTDEELDWLEGNGLIKSNASKESLQELENWINRQTMLDELEMKGEDAERIVNEAFDNASLSEKEVDKFDNLLDDKLEGWYIDHTHDIDHTEGKKVDRVKRKLKAIVLGPLVHGSDFTHQLQQPSSRKTGSSYSSGSTSIPTGSGGGGASASLGKSSAEKTSKKNASTPRTGGGQVTAEVAKEKSSSASFKPSTVATEAVKHGWSTIGGYNSSNNSNIRSRAVKLVSGEGQGGGSGGRSDYSKNSNIDTIELLEQKVVALSRNWEGDKNKKVYKGKVSLLVKDQKCYVLIDKNYLRLKEAIEKDPKLEDTIKGELGI